MAAFKTGRRGVRNKGIGHRAAKVDMPNGICGDICLHGYRVQEALIAVIEHEDLDA